MVRLSLALLLAATVPWSDPILAEQRWVSPGELGQALEDAQTGDTLHLSPGIHPGPLIITRPVRLIGQTGSVLQGTGEGAVLTLSSDHVLVSNLKVQGSGADLSRDDAVILLLETRNVTVEQCEVEARAFGIYVRGGGNNRIAGNVVRGDPALPVARRGNGIHLWHTERNEVLNNELLSVRDGLYLSFAHENQIRGNEGTRLRYGIHYMYSEHNTLVGNHFSGCTGGITLMFSRDNHVEANLSVDNRDFGILGIQLERSVLTGNQIFGNGRGLYLENSTSNRFLANRIENNGVGAYMTAGSEANRFSGNRFWKCPWSRSSIRLL